MIWPRLPSISHLAWALITPYWLHVWKTGFITQRHPYTSLPASYDLGSHRCVYGYPPPCASLMLLAYFKLSLSLDVITIKQKKKCPHWLANPPPPLWVSEYLRQPSWSWIPEPLALNCWGLSCFFSQCVHNDYRQSKKNSSICNWQKRKNMLLQYSSWKLPSTLLLEESGSHVRPLQLWVRTEDMWLVLEKSAMLGRLTL